MHKIYILKTKNIKILPPFIEKNKVKNEINNRIEYDRTSNIYSHLKFKLELL